MKYHYLLFILFCLLLPINMGAKTKTDKTKGLDLSLETRRLPYAVYIATALPMALDSSSENPFILNKLKAHGFTFLHYKSKDDLPTSLKRSCTYRKKLTLLYFNASKRKYIELSEIESLEAFDVILKDYRELNDKRRRQLLLLEIRQHIRIMSQRKRRKSMGNTGQASSSVFVGRDISDALFERHRKALVALNKRENVGLEKTINTLVENRKRYKEEKIVFESNKSQRPGITTDNNGPIRLNKKNLQTLLSKWLYKTGSVSFKAKNYLYDTHPEDRRNLFRVLSEHRFRTTEEHAMLKRQHTQLVSYGEREAKLVELHINLPESYKGKRATPMVIRLHGHDSNGKDYAKKWIPDSNQGEKLIAITPHIPSLDEREKNNWNRFELPQIFLAIYRHMIKNYHIDLEKIYVSGFSDGGQAAFKLGQIFPHYISAICSRGDIAFINPKNPEHSMSVMKHVSACLLVGHGDSENRRNRFKMARHFYNNNKFKGSYFFVKDREHDDMADYDSRIYKFLLFQKREFYPKKFKAYFHIPKEHQSLYKKMKEAHENQDENSDIPFRLDIGFTQQYWIKATRFDEEGTTCDVSVKDNRIVIKAPHLKQCELYLNDELVDMNKSVTVLLNNRVVYHDKVIRNTHFLIDQFETTRDTRHLYWNRIKIRSFN